MFKNLRLKLLALLIGTIFWAGVVTTNNNVRTYDGRLEIKPFNLAENLVIANEIEPVRLRVAAPNDVFANLSERGFEVYIDLKGLGEGEYTVPINVTPQNPKITIARVLPAVIKVALEHQNEKEIPVAVQIKGKPSPNFTINEPKIDLQIVKVSGPQSLLDTASRAVAFVQLNGDEDVDIAKKIPLVVVDSNENELKRIKPEIPDANVLVTLTQILKTKTVGVRAKLINDLPDRNLWISKITMSPPTITIKGDYGVLQATDYIETEPIDLKLVDGNFLRRFKVNLPDRIELEGATNSVLIQLELSKLK
ncbi:hypothetical protein HZA43_04445 [Candidatus Peregrinibacteria bacterium]|nr:hypothetical protein [Candidatus Peregrinibacteria bacterium]